MYNFYLFDSNFEHHGEKESLSCFPGYSFRPKKVEWDRPKPGTVLDPNKLAFYTDNFVNRVVTPKEKSIAWLLEPRTLSSETYRRFIEEGQIEKFSVVLTHDETLLSLVPQYKNVKILPYIFGGAWIKPEDAKVYPKTKNVCIISSYKRQTSGHNLRHEIIEKFSEKYGIDVYGNGYKPFTYTPDVLKDYRFCIVVENVKNGYWLTEKWTTPVLCGCVPIYYGSEDPFVRMPKFDDLSELEEILARVVEKPIYWYDLYQRHYSSINFRWALDNMICEDALIENLESNGIIECEL